MGAGGGGWEDLQQGLGRSKDEFTVVRTKAPGAGAQVRESQNSLGLVESSSSN